MSNRTLHTNITNIKFKNNHIVYENFIKCTVKDYEYNLSYNPTLLSGSQGVLIPYSSSNTSNIVYINTGSNTNYGILKNFTTGSIISSDGTSSFSPYVSTVGLYNDAQELLGIAKMAAPMPLAANTDMTFLVKYDTIWVDKPYFTPSPTPSVTPSVTPSITPTISVTPSITATPSITPSITATPSITPSTTPPITPSVTPTATPSVTPSITPSVPMYELNFYGKLGDTVYDDATIYYSLNNSTWYPIAQPIDSTSCNLIDQLSFPNGTTVYVSLREGTGVSGIGYNAVPGPSCPSNDNYYCEYAPASVLISANTNIYLTAYVNGSSLFELC